MKVSYIQPGFVCLTPKDEILRFPAHIEEAGRTCYRSEDRAGADTAEKFCRMLIRRGHESVLEHCQVRFKLLCDRATSHQLVRHRLCSFSQESQRFVAYRESLEIVRPPVFCEDHPRHNPAATQIWEESVEAAALGYHKLMAHQIIPENARSLLPNCTATRIVMSANIRQWRWVFTERAINKRAQDQIRFLMQGMLAYLNDLVPCLFYDLVDGGLQAE